MTAKPQRNWPRIISLATTACWFAFVVYGLPAKKIFYLDEPLDWVGFLLFTAVISGGGYLLPYLLIRGSVGRRT